MGYKLAIVPGLLMKSVIGVCEIALSELRTTHRHPAPIKEMTVREMFERVGASEWDALRGNSDRGRAQRLIGISPSPPC
jgi:hypothetical protein